ncbi:MAG: hypothetical protein ACPGOY_07505 [Rhodospirillaceae bacterium]
MSDLLMNQMQVILSKLSEDVQRMGDLSTDQISTLLDSMDDLAAHVLGTKAVVAVMAQKAGVSMDDVNAWIEANTSEGASHEKIKAVAANLVTGEKPEV